MQIATRVGQAAGQCLGGLLSHPEKNIKLFDTPFWHQYPFALPGLAAGAIGTLTWLYSAFSLREVSRAYFVLCHLANKRDVQDDAFKFSKREAVCPHTGK